LIVDARLATVGIDKQAKYAIVGAGAAGMLLARELAKVAPVILIESGGLEGDPSEQESLTGESVSLPYPVHETRARQLGGSTALWAGYCAQFDGHDFQARDWVPASGWPFGLEALEPYYRQVASLLNIRELNFNARQIAQGCGERLLFEKPQFAPTVWRFGTPIQRFGESLRDEFERAPNLLTVLRAFVVNIRLDDTHGMVRELIIRTRDGREGHIQADLFVLACGGIETPRLLLNSNQQIPSGVGNASGMVGRCFMEHPHRTITPLLLEESRTLQNWLARGVFGDGEEFMHCLGLSADMQRSQCILNARAHIFRTPAMKPGDPPQMGLFMEQEPNPKSRVLLSEKTDALGLRKVCLDWQLSELDQRSFEITATVLARECEELGLGRMMTPLNRASERNVLHSNHHLGTTRMSVHQEEGVVDADCRVHDVENLYVIGGSVFPTVSWANPTFTLMALTYRLVEYLQERAGYEPAAAFEEATPSSACSPSAD
jgi:choline dehydrogenase-like flavoprotein